MLINFPNQLTGEEEQLLKKIAKMKKKKKQFCEKNKSMAKEAADSHQSANTTPNQSGTPSSTTKKQSNPSPNITSSAASVGKQIDAKEAAKKLIQSGAIKFETENKEKGFKRSCSRKDDAKKMSFGSSESTATYSSVTSPNSATSPSMTANSPFYNTNKFTFPGDNQHSPQSNPNRNNFRQKSFQNTFNPPGSSPGFEQPPNFHRYPGNNFNNQTGVNLFIKANNVTEELLRSLFNANVSQAKILSIDVKTNFAFVTVDTKEAAENAIQELNGKTFQDSLFSVSLARPRKPFNRNHSYGSGYERSNSGSQFGQQGFNAPNTSSNFSPTKAPSGSANTQGDNNPSRQIINYEDI